MKTLDQLYEKFIVNLINDNNNAFLVYILNQPFVKKFVLDQFNSFYNKTQDSDSVWFFKNCCYLYLFVNGKANFHKIELKAVFDCFFDQFKENDEGFPDIPINLEKL